MSTVLKRVENYNKLSGNTSNTPLMEKFASRQSNEIVIAFAGPIGCGIQSVINKARSSLLELGYERVEVIKLSKFLSKAVEDGRISTLSRENNTSEKFYHYRKLQQAGREIRESSHNKQILAEYAVQQIVLNREAHPQSNFEDGEQPVPARVAYLIDQVKRPEEVELLRALYRNLFYLAGVTKPYAQRKKLLEEEGVYETETPLLIDIDRNEEGDGGQRLDKTLHLADFFVRNDANLDHRKSITRFMRLIHGDKSQTPDRLETGMYAAYAAGLRSACLSRQVGAAIANKSGEIIATGCNDVPAPLGGLYSVNSPEDFRCVHKGGECHNDKEKRKLQHSIGEVVKAEFKKQNINTNLDGWLEKFLDAIYKETRLGSLIEFSRSVHAEMDAIVSLARSGSVGIAGATLYTTTFPCHSCARHIVAAGVSEVYYIEPYEKSMAQELHDDAISFEDPKQTEREELTPSSSNRQRVKFLHFEGVSPRLFATVFRAEERKDKKTGQFIPISTDGPRKILPEYMDNYRDFEDAAVKHLHHILENQLPAKQA
ncbi:deaminase [Delftia acidovorans]|uniref:anti-phage dCTP deaminase n=1 Tax=Delftia acidovorans TaxID=80866 RepID=UPI001EFE5236|nr:anti-phage dCTP deaminase [Delftia acidovorans]MCG8988812.1 deaminase [Delftia acidovorans]